jgi:predicted nucleic acid-binding protein
MQSQSVPLTALKLLKMIVKANDDAPIEEVVRQALTMSTNDLVIVEVSHKGKRFEVSAENVIMSLAASTQAPQQLDKPILPDPLQAKNMNLLNSRRSGIEESK